MLFFGFSNIDQVDVVFYMSKSGTTWKAHSQNAVFSWVVIGPSKDLSFVELNEKSSFGQNVIRST